MSINHFSYEASSEALLTAFEAFLLERPTPDQLLEFIALRVLAAFDTRAALVTMLSSSGYLVLVGKFGHVDTHYFSKLTHTVWNEDPLSQALKKDRPSFHDLSRGNDGSHEYFTVRMNNLLTIPLISPPQPSAVLAFGSPATSRVVDGTFELAERVGRLTSLYLGLAGYLTVESTSGHNSTDGSGMERRLLDELTPRQETVLQLIAQGLRNKQIAFTIGYSESLVRQETMEIYRKLGVKGRHEAAALARRLGLTSSQYTYVIDA